MKTFQLTFIDKMNALGFILDEIKNLPSALQLRLKENYPLELSDKVLSRISNDKYQIIIPQDENELTINPVEFFIYDVNRDQFIKDNINGTQDSVQDGDFAILESYCGDSVISTLDKVKVYSKVNPNAEDWNKISTKYSELLKKYDGSKSIPLSDMKDFVSIYNEIPDLTLLEVMNEAEPQVTEPEVAPSAETVVEPSVNAEPELAAASEPAVEPEVTEPAVAEAIAEPAVEPQVTEPVTEPEAVIEPAVEPTEPEVTPTEPEVQPEEPKTEEVNLDEMYEKLDSFETKLDDILEELGLDGEDPKESLISYGKLMKTLSQVDMGGVLL